MATIKIVIDDETIGRLADAIAAQMIAEGKSPFVAKETQTLGASSVPMCQCNEPAAYVVGSTNGKSWKRWVCNKGSGGDWRNKCDFSEWIR